MCSFDTAKEECIQFAMFYFLCMCISAVIHWRILKREATIPPEVRMAFLVLATLGWPGAVILWLFAFLGLLSYIIF